MDFKESVETLLAFMRNVTDTKEVTMGPLRPAPITEGEFNRNVRYEAMAQVVYDHYNTERI